MYYTIIASISSWDIGVLLGWRDAFPPRVFSDGADFEKKLEGTSLATGVAWVWVAEPKIWYK